MAERERLPDRGRMAGDADKGLCNWIRGLLASPLIFVRHALDAAHYLVAYGQRFWLRRVRLAAAYRLLGKELWNTRLYRNRFPWLYARLDKVSQRLATLDTPPGDLDASSRLAKAVRAAILRLRSKAQIAIFQQRRRALFRRIGHAAFAVDQEACGPQLLTREIRSCLDRLDRLDREIERLSRPTPGKLLSPKRIAWTLLVVLVLLLLLLAWWQSAWVASSGWSVVASWGADDP
jgi:hypothetical protein